jgi:predicted choloylglycine hydrolase
MQKRFVAAREDQPGAAWLGRFVEGRNETERWYRGEGLAPPASAAECRDALVKHMPELLPEYDRVCSLVGDDEFAHRILSHYRPPPLVFGCSQAVWLGADGPALVRNYDFPLAIVSDRFESSSWFGREVISKNQRPWGGCLDGMNASGLVASVTFGGSPAQGLGFSVILLVRYVLESSDRDVSERHFARRYRGLCNGVSRSRPGTRCLASPCLHKPSGYGCFLGFCIEEWNCRKARVRIERAA